MLRLESFDLHTGLFCHTLQGTVASEIDVNLSIDLLEKSLFSSKVFLTVSDAKSFNTIFWQFYLCFLG